MFPFLKNKLCFIWVKDKVNEIDRVRIKFKKIGVACLFNNLAACVAHVPKTAKMPMKV
jgi:hypothetical protein